MVRYAERVCRAPAGRTALRLEQRMIICPGVSPLLKIKDLAGFRGRVFWPIWGSFGIRVVRKRWLSSALERRALGSSRFKCTSKLFGVQANDPPDGGEETNLHDR